MERSSDSRQRWADLADSEDEGDSVWQDRASIDCTSWQTNDTRMDTALAAASDDMLSNSGDTEPGDHEEAMQRAMDGLPLQLREPRRLNVCSQASMESFDATCTQRPYVHLGRNSYDATAHSEVPLSFDGSFRGMKMRIP